jgi:hypothetical protein
MPFLIFSLHKALFTLSIKLNSRRSPCGKVGERRQTDTGEAKTTRQVGRKQEQPVEMLEVKTAWFLYKTPVLFLVK